MVVKLVTYSVKLNGSTSSLVGTLISDPSIIFGLKNKLFLEDLPSGKETKVSLLTAVFLYPPASLM